jgi:hypothetical protein
MPPHSTGKPYYLASKRMSEPPPHTEDPPLSSISSAASAELGFIEEKGNGNREGEWAING